MKRIIAVLLVIITLQSMAIAHCLPIVIPHDRWAALTWAHDLYVREHRAQVEVAMLELGNERIPAMPDLKELPR